MALFQNGIDRAAGELEKLQTARAKLAEVDAADRAKLQELRASLPDVEVGELLDGAPSPAPGEFAAGATRLRHEVFALDAAIDGRDATRKALMARIRAAIVALAHARAEALRKQTSGIERQLAQHHGKVSELCGKLRELDGCDYSPRLVLPAAFDAKLVAAAIHASQVAVGPVTARLMADIAELLRQADAIEASAAQACEGGHATGATLADLLTAVGDKPLAPPRAAIQGWYERVSEGAQQAWDARYANSEARVVPKATAMYFSLRWTAEGQIAPESAATISVTSPFELEARVLAQQAAVAIPAAASPAVRIRLIRN